MSEKTEITDSNQTERVSPRGNTLSRLSRSLAKAGEIALASAADADLELDKDEELIAGAISTRLEHEDRLFIGQDATLADAKAILNGRKGTPGINEYALDTIIEAYDQAAYSQLLARRYDSLTTAASVLLLSVVFPREFPNNDSTYSAALKSLWAKHILKNRVDLNLHEMNMDDKTKLNQDIVILCNNRLQSYNSAGKRLSSEQLQCIGNAADALQLASDELFMLACEFLKFGNKTDTLNCKDGAEGLDHVADLVRVDIINNAFLKPVDSTDLERVFIGLDALWMVSGNTIQNILIDNSLRDKDDSLNVIRKNLSSMVAALQAVFVDNNVSANTPDSIVKGKLHELLWLLDGYIIILSNEEYRGVSIHPAPDYMDRPIIGRPEINHGIDYTVTFNKAEGIVINTHQLKSGTHDSKIYHPSIIPSVDGDFRGEMDKRRLSVRLKLYSDIITSNFQIDSDAMKKFLGDERKPGYALKSVRQALNGVLDLSKAHSFNIATVTNVPAL